jgi:hypothetical protein
MMRVFWFVRILFYLSMASAFFAFGSLVFAENRMAAVPLGIILFVLGAACTWEFVKAVVRWRRRP